jgi:hypothetical protein
MKKISIIVVICDIIIYTYFFGWGAMLHPIFMYNNFKEYV